MRRKKALVIGGTHYRKYGTVKEIVKGLDRNGVGIYTIDQPGICQAVVDACNALRVPYRVYGTKRYPQIQGVQRYVRYREAGTLLERVIESADMIIVIHDGLTTHEAIRVALRSGKEVHTWSNRGWTEPENLVG